MSKALMVQTFTGYVLADIDFVHKPSLYELQINFSTNHYPVDALDQVNYLHMYNPRIFITNFS